MVRKSSKFISSASPSASCRRFLPRAEPPVMGSRDPPGPPAPACCRARRIPRQSFRAGFFPKAFSLNVCNFHPGSIEPLGKRSLPSHVLLSEDKPITPTLPVVLGMFLPLVEKGMDDFPPNWVEFQIGDAVKILLAAKETETAQSVREPRRREMLRQSPKGWCRSPNPILSKQSWKKKKEVLHETPYLPQFRLKASCAAASVCAWCSYGQFLSPLKWVFGKLWDTAARG